MDWSRSVSLRRITAETRRGAAASASAIIHSAVFREPVRGVETIFVFGYSSSFGVFEQFQVAAGD
jgi:hypothetical protein